MKSEKPKVDFQIFAAMGKHSKRSSRRQRYNDMVNGESVFETPDYNDSLRISFAKTLRQRRGKCDPNRLAVLRCRGERILQFQTAHPLPTDGRFENQPGRDIAKNRGDAGVSTTFARSRLEKKYT